MDTSLDFFYKKAHDIKEVLPEEFFSKVAFSVLSALCCMKQKEFLHRDIKPSNILINKDGTIKLCDFGISGRLVNSINKSYKGCQIYMPVWFFSN